MPLTPPTTRPLRTMTQAVFDACVAARMEWDEVNVEELSALQVDVTAKQILATTAANDAAAYASAPVWVSGVYAQGDPVYSPLSLMVYRCRTAGSRTTDPSLDSPNWQLQNGQTPSQTGNAGKVRRTDGTTEFWGEVGTHGADIASATTINLTTATGDYVDVTGNVPVTGVTLADGAVRKVRFTGITTLTAGASLVLLGSTAIITAVGDWCVFIGGAGGITYLASYTRKDGTALVAPIEAVGTIKFSPTAFDSTYKKMDGSTYLQSAYPAGYALVGLRPVEAPTMRPATAIGVNIAGMYAVGATCVILTNSGTLLYSKTGVSWPASGPSSVAWVKVIGTRIFAATSAAPTTIYYSDNECVSWSTFTIPTAYSGSNAMVEAGGRYFIAVGSPTYLISSATGISGWTNCTGITDTVGNSTDSDRYGSIAEGIASVGGKWCARPQSTPNNVVWSSTDGIAFTARTLGNSGGASTKLFVMNDAFFVSSPLSGTTSYLHRSTDAITWTNVHPTTGTTRTSALVNAKYIGNKYYVWDDYGVFVSMDGASSSSWRGVYGQPMGAQPARTLGVQQLNNAPVWLYTDVNSTPVVAHEIINDQMYRRQGVNISGTTAGDLFYAGNASAATRGIIKNNVVFYFPTGNGVTPYIYTLTAGGSLSRFNATQFTGSTMAGGFHFCITTDRIFFGSATTDTNHLLVSDTLFPFNYLTEFAMPNLVEPTTGTPAYMKVAA